MGGYSKNIAVIRGLKDGFSIDGGQLSGLVKVEKYSSTLKVELSLINFAPLTQGKYVCAISDGQNSLILDGVKFEGVSELDTSDGFAALICFVNGEVSPIACAVCGPFQSAALILKGEIERQEKRGEPKIKYEDEALAEENYYEFEQTHKNGGVLRTNQGEEKEGNNAEKNEENKGAYTKQEGLAEGNFYTKVKGEIDRIFSRYPAESGLEKTVEGSRWAKIDYGENRHYVFGVIYEGERPRYICYGVPSNDSKNPPRGLDNCSFVPTYGGGNCGYWVMFQDANTGSGIKISLE